MKMRKLLYKSLLLILFIFCAQQAQAIPLVNSAPKYVYRVTSRPPVVVFVKGFRNWGDDINYLHDVQGVSLGGKGYKRNTAFTTATSSLHAALYIAKKRFENTKDYLENKPQSHTLWIYKIRTNKDFYSLQASLRRYENLASKLSDAKARRGLLNLTTQLWDRYQNSKEWFALTIQLSNTQVVEASKLVLENHNYKLIDKRTNPHYKDTNAMPVAPYAFPLYVSATKTNKTKITSKNIKILASATPYIDYNHIFVFKDDVLRRTPIIPSACDASIKWSRMYCGQLTKVELKRTTNPIKTLLKLSSKLP